ncbi:single-stranded DNA-binding protein [Eubacterium ventriosum]|uniref:single-stranded DNA-binding protein n=1 Tax=Eubacterium ventriosum TaxID=39496 RepID=UPI00265E0AD2|nr:single-stranded DNA-binding protein [Eubacterium ventriosum]
MNRVILMGRAVREPDVKYTAGDTPLAIARYTLAVNRRYSKDGDADFIRCVAFGKAGEFAEKYVQQGTKLIVEGRIQTGSYEKNGKTTYTTEVVVESQEFAESKKNSQNAGENNNDNEFVNVPDDVQFPFPV